MESSSKSVANEHVVRLLSLLSPETLQSIDQSAVWENEAETEASIAEQELVVRAVRHEIKKARSSPSKLNRRRSSSKTRKQADRKKTLDEFTKTDRRKKQNEFTETQQRKKQVEFTEKDRRKEQAEFTDSDESKDESIVSNGSIETHWDIFSAVASMFSIDEPSANSVKANNFSIDDNNKNSEKNLVKKNSQKGKVSRSRLKKNFGKESGFFRKYRVNSTEKDTITNNSITQTIDSRNDEIPIEKHFNFIQSLVSDDDDDLSSTHSMNLRVSSFEKDSMNVTLLGELATDDTKQQIKTLPPSHKFPIALTSVARSLSKSTNGSILLPNDGSGSQEISPKNCAAFCMSSGKLPNLLSGAAFTQSLYNERNGSSKLKGRRTKDWRLKKSNINLQYTRPITKDKLQKKMLSDIMEQGKKSCFVQTNPQPPITHLNDGDPASFIVNKMWNLNTLQNTVSVNLDQKEDIDEGNDCDVNERELEQWNKLMKPEDYMYRTLRATEPIMEVIDHLDITGCVDDKYDTVGIERYDSNDTLGTTVMSMQSSLISANSTILSDVGSMQTEREDKDVKDIQIETRDDFKIRRRQNHYLRSKMFSQGSPEERLSNIYRPAPRPLYEQLFS
mmetsp:Transcript_10827/g.23793  ORF Transcript_10827/g.23793 Transcript_10827/m.23793 type:complete len:617 (-) Transcript_10827:151-2001(-)